MEVVTKTLPGIYFTFVNEAGRMAQWAFRQDASLDELFTGLESFLKHAGYPIDQQNVMLVPRLIDPAPAPDVNEGHM